MKPDQALAYWVRALGEEFGLAIPILNSSEPVLRKAQKILYDARKASGNAELGRLMMVMPNGGKEIWLIKKEVELEDA